MSGNKGPLFVTLGLFIVDEFEFKDENGEPTGKTLKSQIGGGGTYAVIGARMWLPPGRIGMIVDKGYDFPKEIEEKLLGYGEDMWLFRDQPDHPTTRALNSYHGDYRNFKYLTDRIRITPRDIEGSKLGRPRYIHFICSPKRAKQILSDIQEVPEWSPTVIYEPIPDSCVPEALPALKEVLPNVHILSPNAEEALSLLSVPHSPTRTSIEKAAQTFLDFGVAGGQGWVIIRSGQLGAYVKSRGKEGVWIDAFWTESEEDARHVVDVTGAGNSFLGGLAAGLTFSEGDVYEATLFATVSASFAIEQGGLPVMTADPQNTDVTNWNGDSPMRRLEKLREKLRKRNE
ncbi:hypothetical protein Agabi119p4_4771 [Agaricus bisporus var. burnettii]|uniref:Carbohydrate kinase PfkB domain-containing protein n=1 Tax=Agaricus bisporus var. burnettii TaxID=192524 RepID=A0A8H7F431_AGABI|nr:hypothetical protein Agabi119p4_4771 [Agaricus bisporus var. burnettii]